MTTIVIITICSLLLLAYIFDISSTFTRIPTVILLLLTGWLAKQFITQLEIQVPDLQAILKVLGTIGLILIVLEGALELELNRSKLKILGKSTLIASGQLFLIAGILAFAFKYYSGTTWRIAFTNAIPLCVISSSVAIPSVRNFHASIREFVVYESSLSDIFGVLFFNFIVLNESITGASFGAFGGRLLLISFVSFISVLGLAFLLSRIKHHITYAPIILLVILIYSFSKIYHLPGLLFILVFGLFLGNLEELKSHRWINIFRPEKLEQEVKKFKEITIEATFMVRGLFFLLFGFLMNAEDILNIESLTWAAGIITVIFLSRLMFLKLLHMPLHPLTFISPRGLITILLFLSIAPSDSLIFVNNTLIIQTIILSVLLMMFGLMGAGKSSSLQKDLSR